MWVWSRSFIISNPRRQSQRVGALWYFLNTVRDVHHMPTGWYVAPGGLHLWYFYLLNGVCRTFFWDLSTQPCVCVRQLSGRESRRVLDQIMKGDRSNCLFFFVRFFSWRHQPVPIKMKQHLHFFDSQVVSKGCSLMVGTRSQSSQYLLKAERPKGMAQVQRSRMNCSSFFCETFSHTSISLTHTLSLYLSILNSNF